MPIVHWGTQQCWQSFFNCMTRHGQRTLRVSTADNKPEELYPWLGMKTTCMYNCQISFIWATGSRREKKKKQNDKSCSQYFAAWSPYNPVSPCLSLYRALKYHLVIMKTSKVLVINTEVLSNCRQIFPVMRQIIQATVWNRDSWLPVLYL